MKPKNTPTYINSVDELFKYYLLGDGDKLYVSNLIPAQVVECFAEICDNDIKIIIFDYKEFYGEEYVDLKRNGLVEFKLNKTIKIYKQKYYYWSKGKIKYKTTMWEKYIKKHCNYTRNIQNCAFTHSKVCYVSYENSAEIINEKNNTQISRQSMYLYEREACSVILPKREEELWNKIKKLGIEASGYYHYDEEYIKINKEVYVRLSIIDAHTSLIINDILVHEEKFDKDYIKSFLIESLSGLPLECIITDGHIAYPKIMDELGVKHQLCQFHIMQVLMKPLNKSINGLNSKIESTESAIIKKEDKIEKLKKEYPYKQGRTPKNDKKAIENVNKRKQLKREKSKTK